MLSDVLPTNLEDEKAQFFKSLLDGSIIYAPQFNYLDDLKAETVRASYDNHLQSCKESHPELFALAEVILKGVQKDYGSCVEYMAQVYGASIELDVANHMATQYIEKHGLGDLLETKWLEGALESSIKGNVITLEKRENHHRKNRFLSILDHEIGTHFLRRHNQSRIDSEVLPKPRRGWLLATEEGLAAINTHKCYPDKRLWRPALNYFAAHLSAEHAWPELWSRVSEYADDLELCWTVCVKVKRGVKDTGAIAVPLFEEVPEPQVGFYKDMCYFVGAVDLLRVRQEIDWQKIHACKFSLQEFPDMLRYVDPHGENVILPWFLQTDADLQNYKSDVELLAKANGIL